MIMQMILIGVTQMILTIMTIITMKVILKAEIILVTTIWEIMTTTMGTLTGTGNTQNLLRNSLFWKKTTCLSKERTF